MHPAYLILTMSIVEVLSMAGAACFPALLPVFLREWGLSNTEAGWITSVSSMGYLGAVVVLSSLTDRFDAKRIYLVCLVVGVVGLLGFSFYASGVWSAVLWMGLGGISLAGTYMPGLRILSDRTEGRLRQRAVSFYTASFGIGTSLSMYISGKIEPALGWEWVFRLAAIGPIISLFIVMVLVPSLPPKKKVEGEKSGAFQFLPVLKNRKTMGYIMAYTAHNWELFSFRTWIVTFLTFHLALQPKGEGIFTPTTLAAIVNLVGLPASVIGNEFSLKIGRKKWVSFVMFSSAGLAFIIGHLADIAPALLALVIILYGITVTADSSSITGGAVAHAEERYMGTTMALHSAIGFSGAFMGPLVFGLVLDMMGGRESALAWGLAFASMGVAVAMGPLMLFVLSRGGRERA